MRYFGKVCAFILFIIAMKFFNDGNMAWWLFMFAFIIVSGFLIGEENIEDEQVEAMLKPRWYDNAHCMECGYVNKACVCKPVSNISNNDYKATYDNSGHDDYIDTAMVNRDAEIANKTPDDDEPCNCKDGTYHSCIPVVDWNHVTDGDVEDFDDEGNPINTVY